MKIPFFQRLQVREIIAEGNDEAGKLAQRMLAGLVADLPELLMAGVVEIQSGKLLASYTATRTYNPNQSSQHDTKLLRLLESALIANPWTGGALTDLSVMLEDQLHHLRPLNGGKWYCFLAIRTVDANLGIAKETMRRHATNLTK